MIARRLLTIGHSYCVALNRRLADALARSGQGEWEVVAVGPAWFRGDLRAIPFESAEDECCRSEPVPVRFSKKIHCMLYGRQLRRMLSDQRWNLVHCWEEPYVAAAAQVAWWTRPQTPLVYSTFQNLSKRYPPPFNWIENYSMGRSSGWIAFGHTVEQTLEGRGIYQRRHHRVIPPGVDLQEFQPDEAAGADMRRRLGWTAGGPPVVGFLGRFIPAKGLDLLMRVLDTVTVPWRALFVGGGPMQSQLQSWGARYGDRVRVVTGVPHDQVPPYLNAMDVLCAPSQTTHGWREQFGRMLVEAFACGVPVVASDSGEIPYVVADAGVVLGENDQPAWLREITDLLENPTRRRELGQHGLERARTVYAWPIVARQHLDFFEELLDQPQRAQSTQRPAGETVRG